MSYAQGMGRNTPEEVVILAKKDLDAMSLFLGNKKFFFGDKPVTVINSYRSFEKVVSNLLVSGQFQLDCDMFAHLSQFLYTPQVIPEVKTYMEEHCQNLVGPKTSFPRQN